jgi:hypothetical protein
MMTYLPMTASSATSGGLPRQRPWSYKMVQTLSCTTLNLIDEIASDCYWSKVLSLILVLVSAEQRNDICSRSYSHLDDRSVWGPVDGRSWLWWVIDNVVWTDSRLSIAGASCGLIWVGAGEERAQKVYALRGLRGVERQVGSARGTRWPAGSSAGCMVARKSKTKSSIGASAG